MVVQEVQQKTTSTEFVKWMHFLEEDVNDFHPEYHYWAAIIAEIRKGRAGKDAGKIKSKDCLLKFVSKTKQQELDPKERAKRSKAIWLGGVWY